MKRLVLLVAVLAVIGAGVGLGTSSPEVANANIEVCDPGNCDPSDCKPTDCTPAAKAACKMACSN
ncbi:MAG: hypothetical protein HKN21_15875 [Candidatus Eisenbacteria bacterium]|uniref:Uncharacterized protein n=1 Tax=Eiseniibacteriota bacterium TaxID=2212470 RepID=A0A7Y2H3W9_UNCEI|nr:hypothetical protein [Candidatus Eisenbacteria bacterium]